MRDYVHILRRVLWFGHPVATLDLVIEAGIHNHTWVWRAACGSNAKKRKRNISVSDVVI